MGRHQPYQPKKRELGYIHALSRINKHRDFTAQTRTETVQRTIKSGGASISFPVGSLRIGGNAQVLIGGVPIDPATMKPAPGRRATVSDVTFVDWRFTDPPVSVRRTLHSLASLVREAVEDVRSTAGL